MSREHPKLGVALLKAPHILVQHRRRKLAVLAVGAHVVLIAHLQNDFMERLLLLAGTYLLIVVLNPAVCPGLLVVVPLEGLVKHLTKNCLDIFLAVGYIQMGAFRVGVLGVELPAVVAYRTLPHHCADRSFQINTPFAAPAAAFVTFCESNAKALLTLRIKSAFAPYGVEWGLCPRRLRTAPPAGPPFEKGTLHPA